MRERERARARVRVRVRSHLLGRVSWLGSLAGSINDLPTGLESRFGSYLGPEWVWVANYRRVVQPRDIPHAYHSGSYRDKIAR